MSKAEERGKTYALHKASEKLHDYYGNAMLSVVQFDGYDIKNAYIDGYHQAEKDLELSWEDIKLVHNITYEESRNVALNKGGEISEQEFYQEVLKRFKSAKEK